ncbi:protein VAC14 homolog isoform X2 [Macrosteles quadrilineatus]|uniref:protein VAC14 homolog isoform X2 n=1 Tax=Macrosteles quadrilineatus TaxID=74068 RepID=UPI0023E12344|nr:protein VAC14 homolog isoform X2 [Macrosteles quadrilineatus]
MSERDYAPLSPACVRALNDKLYDKRKAAALEIEKMVKDMVTKNRPAEIRRLLKVLGQDFANSQNNPHSRKGGLIGLAAMAVALGKDTSEYTEGLIRPILANFNHSDLRVRYYACESLYNVVKVARGAVLPHFVEIFNALANLAADPDQNVKNGSELLDRLMKDIVTESATFDLVGFMPSLRDRIRTKNTFARQFIISWISVLDAVPDIDLIIFLPEILDGLFVILADPTLEIKKMCENVLSEFLRSIKQDPGRVDFAGMINILISHSQATDDLVQFTAITWIKEFVQLAGKEMLPFTSGIMMAILPCLAFDTDARKNIKDTAKAVNYSLMKLISLEDDFVPEPVEVKTEGDSGMDSQLDLPSVVNVLTRQLLHNSVQTKVAVLRWIYHLHTKLPHRMMCHVDELFPILLKVLSDSSDEVVQNDLEVLAEVMSRHPTDNKLAEDHGESKQLMNPYFTKFITSLLKQFSCDKHLLEDRGSFIIRQLCVLLNSKDIYLTLAQILMTEENLKFASIMIETLNMILLTSSELFELRSQLKDLKSEESRYLFLSLYKCWCHNPVATIALCLLTQNYAHVCELIRIFGNLEITVDLLKEVDRLIQLLESPIFTYLRLELLDAPHNEHLVRALYGLLMLLPQADAFHTLRHRLDCIPRLQLYHQQESKPKEVKKEANNSIDFNQLVEHFVQVQEKHRQHKIAARSVAMLEKGVKNIET